MHKFRYSRLGELIVNISPEWLYSFGEIFIKRPFEQELEDINETINYLRSIQLYQTHSLSQILDQQFLEWKTLFGKGDMMQRERSSLFSNM